MVAVDGAHSPQCYFCFVVSPHPSIHPFTQPFLCLLGRYDMLVAYPRQLFSFIIKVKNEKERRSRPTQIDRVGVCFFELQREHNKTRREL